MMRCFAMTACVGLACACFADGLTSATTGVFAVDMRSPSLRRTVLPKDVRYSPRWATDEAGAMSVIEKVTEADTPNATTTTVAVCEAGAEGLVSLEPPAGTLALFRLVHRTVSEGETVGSPLAVDMASGLAAVADTLFAGDSRTNSLQLVMAERHRAALAYSSYWTNDVASLSIDLTDGLKTNRLTTIQAPCEGTYEFAGGEVGWRRLLLTSYDAHNQVIATCQSEAFRLSGGFVIILR